MSLRQVLLLANLVSLALLGFFLWRAWQAGDHLGRISHEAAKRTGDLQLLDQASAATDEAGNRIADLIINHDLASFRKSWPEFKAKVQALDRDASRVADKEEEKAWVALTSRLRQEHDRLAETELLGLCEAVKDGPITAEIRALDHRLDGLRQQLKVNYKHFLDAVRQESEAADQETDLAMADLHRNQLWAAIGGGLSAALFGLGAAFWAVRRVGRSARQAGAAGAGLAIATTHLLDRATAASTGAATISSAATQLRANVSAMAAAAEEMSANVGSVGATAEEMSAGMATVASAVEEMSASARGVAASAGKGADEAGKARERATGAASIMSELGQAAKDIGQVSQSIKRLAEQTNLLALNAAIEAASAGEAGRGFAVVAGEVKQLAQQSAAAAEDIAKRIGQVQNRTQAAVGTVQEVSALVEGISQAVEEISRSSEQQANAAAEVASSVQQAKDASTQLTRAIADLGQGSKEVAANAASAASATGSLEQEAGLMATEARRLGEEADEVALATNTIGSVTGDLRRLAGTRDADAGNRATMISRAKTAHVAWRARLRHAIAGKGSLPPPEQARLDDACELGRWLHGEGERCCAGQPGFAELLQQHRDFHRRVGELIPLIAIGKGAEVYQDLESGKLAEHSRKVIALLEGLAKA